MCWWCSATDLCYGISRKVTFYSGEAECKMFKKSYYSRSRPRTPAKSKDGAICNKQTVYYRTVTRSSILNVGRGPRGFFWLQWYLVKFKDMLKLVSAIFLLFKKWFLNFCISDFPSLSPLGHCFRGWWKINLKAYDVINCPNKNLTSFIWYFATEKRCDIETLSTDVVLDKEHLYEKTMQKMYAKS